MNIVNSRALLLCIFICISALTSGAAFSTGDKNKVVTKEIIIVSIDQDVNNQIASLAQYTYDLYQSNEKGLVTIKKYFRNTTSDEKTITLLIGLLTELGVSAADIIIQEEELKLDQPYFTLSICAGPEVQ